MLSRKTLIGVLSFLLAGASVVSAQQDCAAVRTEEGEAAYQRCQVDERETRVKEQVKTYKENLEEQKDRVAEYYELKELSAEEDWERADFSFEREIRVYEDRIRAIRRDEGSEEERERMELIIDELDLRRKLLKKHYDKFTKVLAQRAKLEEVNLDLQLAAYELQIRGWPGIPYTP